MKTKLNKSAVLKANGMEIVITGETEKAYLGYLRIPNTTEPIGQTSLLKNVFDNPHLSKRIQILSN